MQPSHFVNLLNYRFIIGWIIKLDIKQRCLAGCTCQLAHSRNGNQLPAAVAVLHDAADAELVVEHLDRITHRIRSSGGGILAPRTSEHIVHDYVVRSLKWSPGEKDKRLERIPCCKIDAVENLDTACR